MFPLPVFVIKSTIEYIIFFLVHGCFLDTAPAKSHLVLSKVEIDKFSSEFCLGWLKGVIS